MVDAPPIVHGYFDKKIWNRKVTKRKYKFFTVVGLKCFIDLYEFDIFQKEE